MEPLRFNIPVPFLPYVDSAFVRFSYLYPEIDIKIEKNIVDISGIGTEKQNGIKREFFHLLYKEKIYVETLDIRRQIYSGIAGA